MHRYDTRRVRGGRLIGGHHGLVHRGYGLGRGRARVFQGSAARDGWQYWSKGSGLDDSYAQCPEGTVADIERFSHLELECRLPGNYAQVKDDQTYQDAWFTPYC